MTRRKKLGFYDLLNRVEKNRISRFSISSVSGLNRAMISSSSSSLSCSGYGEQVLTFQNIRFAVILKCQVRSYSMFPIQAAQFLFDYRFQD